jgi:hypothetical protein
MLARKMHFIDTEKSGSYFGLYESKDGATVGRSLDMAENVAAAYSRCSKLIYQVRLFMPAVIESQDSKMIAARYIQVRAAHAQLRRSQPLCSFGVGVCVCVCVVGRRWYIV